LRAAFRVLGLAILALAGAGAGAPAAAKYSSIVINEETGAVLHAVNPDVRHYPASLTKVMTLYLVFEALKAKRLTMDTMVTVSLRAARQPASKLDLKPREKIAVRDLILGLTVKSANDAATAIAEHMAGTERKFGELMSAKARQLGMANTRFRNASGLPNRRQLTTARDFAILARAIRRSFPEYYRFFRTRSFTYKSQRIVNHNRLLDRYAGADGLKTGYIRASGFNLAASAERDGVRLIAVVLGARSPRSRDLHTMGLLERAFEKATNGEHAAYPYDRNIRVARDDTRILERIRVRRAPGARGRIRLSRLTPPKRPDFAAGGEQGSSARPASDPLPVAGWSVQIGTFSRVSLAELAARRARTLVPDPLQGSTLVVKPIIAPGKTLYRALYMGLARDAAERACTRLEETGRSCLTRAPETQNGQAPAPPAPPIN
jgi:D-alanyl-D-alanine carboxypeptidase